MNDHTAADERLIAKLLRVNDAVSEPLPENHLDDEILAEFSSGTLGEARQAAAVLHLADCAECREVVALLLKDAAANAASATTLPPREIRRPLVWTVIALAASLLLAVGLWRWPLGASSEAELFADAKKKLYERDFAAVERLADEAERRGVSSSRLRNLKANAARKIPDPSALAYAGRLNNFGFDLGGVVARGPKPTEGLDVAAAALHADDRLSRLNLGHLELSRNQPVEARKLFQGVLAADSNDAEAWLGLGLADFMIDDFAAAELGFAKAATLDPNNLTAIWNRAMTLEELGHTEDAAALWRVILPQLSDEKERRKVEAHLATLPPPLNEVR